VEFLDVESSFSKLIKNISPLDESIPGVGEPLYIFIFLSDSEDIVFGKTK
jgi:hypothetical protein